MKRENLDRLETWDSTIRNGHAPNDMINLATLQSVAKNICDHAFMAVSELHAETDRRLTALESLTSKHETLLCARCSISAEAIRWYDNDGRVVASADFVMPPAKTVTVREALDNLKNFTHPLPKTETVADRVDVTIPSTSDLLKRALDERDEARKERDELRNKIGLLISSAQEYLS